LPPIQQHPHASGLPSKVPPGLSDSQDSILGDWLCAHQVSRIIAYRLPNQKYTYPATTATEIGWTWENVQKKLNLPLPPIKERASSITGPASLERFGSYARGRGDVMKWFGGCRESLP
jgi:hypothetical protein